MYSPIEYLRGIVIRDGINTKPYVEIIVYTMKRRHIDVCIGSRAKTYGPRG